MFKDTLTIVLVCLNRENLILNNDWMANCLSRDNGKHGTSRENIIAYLINKHNRNQYHASERIMMKITSFVAHSQQQHQKHHQIGLHHKLSNDKSELLLCTRSVCASMWSGTSWNEIKGTSSSWNFKSVRWQAYSLHNNFGTGTPIGTWSSSKCDTFKYSIIYIYFHDAYVCDLGDN